MIYLLMQEAELGDMAGETSETQCFYSELGGGVELHEGDNYVRDGGQGA